MYIKGSSHNKMSFFTGTGTGTGNKKKNQGSCQKKMSKTFRHQTGNQMCKHSSTDLMTVMNSKIHRATVTEADIKYVGSITIDRGLLEAANIAEWEQITVLNVTNGSRLQTYVIPAERGSKKICINGAAAHLTGVGDIVILVTYKTISSCTITSHHPTIIFVNGKNEIIDKPNNNICQ